MPQVQLNEQLFDQASQRAAAAGFASVDEYVAGVIADDLAVTENLDHRFTVPVIAHLNQIADEIKAGAKTFSEAEVDDYLNQKADRWRTSHAG